MLQWRVFTSDGGPPEEVIAAANEWSRRNDPWIKVKKWRVTDTARDCSYKITVGFKLKVVEPSVQKPET